MNNCIVVRPDSERCFLIVAEQRKWGSEYPDAHKLPEPVAVMVARKVHAMVYSVIDYQLGNGPLHDFTRK